MTGTESSSRVANRVSNITKKAVRELLHSDIIHKIKRDFSVFLKYKPDACFKEDRYVTKHQVLGDACNQLDYNNVSHCPSRVETKAIRHTQTGRSGDTRNI